MGKPVKSVFAHFLFSYLLILFIPLIIGVYAYYKTVYILEDNARSANLSTLEQSKNILDTRFSEIEDLITKLIANSKVNSFKLLGFPLDDEGLFKQYEVAKELSVFDSNRFITGLFIYFQKNDTIVTSNAAYRGMDNYDQFFRYSDLSHDQWKKLMLEKEGRRNVLPAAPAMYKGVTEQRISFVNALSYSPGGQSDGAIVVHVDESEITGLLKNLLIHDGWAYILDNQGRLIVSTDKNAPRLPAIPFSEQTKSGYLQNTIDGNDMLISYTVSAYNGWKYIAILPQSAVLAKALYIKKMIWSIAAIAILLGAFIAAYLSYRNSAPLKELNELIQEFKYSDWTRRLNLYEVIKGTIQEIIVNNKRLQSTMEEQTSILQKILVSRLIRGEFKDKQELDIFMQKAGINLNSKQVTVALLRVNDHAVPISEHFFNELLAYKAEIKIRLMNALPDFTCIEIDKNDGTWGLLIGCEESDEAICKEKIDAAIGDTYLALSQYHSILLTVGVGRLRSNLMNVWHSYDEASEALESRSLPLSILWYEQIPKIYNEYYYPIDIEMRLLNLVRNGDSEKARQIIEVVRSENFEKRLMSSRMRLQLVHELKGTLIKLASQHLDDLELVKATLESSESIAGKIDELYDKITDKILEISDNIQSRKVSHHTKLRSQIMEIIHKSYMDSGFCLAQVADQVALSESYVSFFYKEATGETLSSYVENLRMEHAQKLLKETQIPIQDIAEIVGYTSDKVFRRAFKRSLGIQPTAYRNLNTEGCTSM